MKIVNRIKNIDYRHYVCVAITLGFLCLSVFVFNTAFVRVVQGLIDLFFSVVYYFCFIIEVESPFDVTVNNLPVFPEWLPETPTTTLPETWEAFKLSWGVYWQQWANGDNFLEYLSAIGDVLNVVCQFILLLGVPIILLFSVLFSKYAKNVNNDYNEDTKPLKIFKKVSNVTYRPVKNWVLGFIEFLQEHKFWWKTWLWIWAFNFNVVTVAIEFLAFYLYFVASFNLGSLYIQVYKLALDLWLPFSVIPLWVWIAVGIGVLYRIARRIGYDRLYHNERKNRGFINERGVLTVIKGPMGIGKTAQATDMALSAEVQLRDQALEIILETDMHFPNFPWIVLENQLKKAIEYHEVYSVPSCRRWMRKKYNRWIKNPCKEKIFDYDFERYGLTYDDKLKVIDVWQALEDYACAYLIYTVQSSLLIANYSIRSDVLMDDLGNFPLVDADFFRRDSKLIDSYSRHAHILDFDMLRLGKVMLDNNPNRYAFGFGVYIISEIDKERKNSKTLEGVKASAKDCNQNNDLMETLLKMSRHACVISNRVFVKVFADLQRSGDLAAKTIELGEVMQLVEKGKEQIVLPFFSPFYWIDNVYYWLKGKFDRFNINYRYMRADNTLFMYIVKNIMSKLDHYHERVCNLYGCTTLKIGVESGTEDGNIVIKKYYRMNKKIYPNRYLTDCLNGIFEVRGELNTVGIDDLKEYATLMASDSELQYQNSHFQKDVKHFNVKNE